MKKNILKGLSFLLITSTFITTLTTGACNSVEIVNAQTNEMSITEFATKEDLLTEFDLDGTSDTIGIVNFGKKNSTDVQWYIAGTDSDVTGDELVLFAKDSISDRTFGASGMFAYYHESELCPYVNSLAYGKENSLFTASEDDLMLTITLQKEGACGPVKVYVPHGIYKNKYVSVGTNSTLNIAVTYWGKSFWTRSVPPVSSAICYARMYIELNNHKVDATTDTSFTAGTRPVIEINAENIVFASTAQPGTSNASLNTAMTIRYSGSEKIDAIAGYMDNKIVAIKGNDNTCDYLYIQANDGSDWVYSTAIDNNFILSAEDVHSGLTDFADCKIWIETTDDNLTYANMVSEVTIGQKEGVPATCMSAGNISYWYFTDDNNTYYFSDKDYSDKITYNDTILAVEPNKHDFNEPEFIWSDNMNECKIVFTCNHNTTHTPTYDCMITSKIKKKPTYKEPGIIEYTATYADFVDVKEISTYDITLTPEEKTAEFVKRMYDIALGRSADEAGLNYWTNELINGTKDGATVAKGFIFSKEMNNKNLTNEQFVITMYQTFFNRTPAANDSGRAFWINLLNNGVSRYYVFKGFCQSAEFQAVCDEYQIKRGNVTITENRDKNADITMYVFRCYDRTLNRQPDNAGLNFWTGAIINGDRTPIDVAGNFVFSKEFVNKNLSNEEYIEVLYNMFFDRPSDTAGFNFWLTEMNSGRRDRYKVFTQFANSAEFAEILKKFKL